MTKLVNILLIAMLCIVVMAISFQLLRSSSPSTGKEYRTIFGAIQTGDVKGVTDFLARDSSLKTTHNSHGESLLMHAIKFRQYDVAKYLLETVAVDVNYQMSRTDDTALHFAVMVGEIKIVELLLNHKADITLKNQEGETALDFAKKHSYPDVEKIVKLLTTHADTQPVQKTNRVSL